jgi:hypothetical protein
MSLVAGVRGSPTLALICTRREHLDQVTMIDFGTAKILSHRRNPTLGMCAFRGFSIYHGLAGTFRPRS